MLYISKTDSKNKKYVLISGVGDFSLADTLECGQLFRFEPISALDGYKRYLVTLSDMLLIVGQNKEGEIAVWGIDEDTVKQRVVKYLALDRDYRKIREDIKNNTSSEWMRNATEAGKGISILRQDGWESIFSFIVSQNNNIPRIKKILKAICLEYGKNLALENNIDTCPLNEQLSPCKGICEKCGVCYSFPTPKDILDEPLKMQIAKPGFRYKYLFDAASAVDGGRVDLARIKKENSYDFTVSELSKIKGVGNKVASCAALFGFENLEAFPIDVWMKRAIDNYFDGKFDPKSLGEYAGVAQQYIFHYIRNIENGTN